MSRDFQDAMSELGLIAILRGIKPQEAKQVGQVLLDNGFTAIEVPIRSKSDKFSQLDQNALQSLDILLENFGNRANIAAGTVLAASDLAELKKRGVTDSLAPNFNPEIVTEATRLGVRFLPGIETLSEAKQALALGALGVKLFPCVLKDPAGSILYRHAPSYVRLLTGFLTGPIYPSGGIDWTTAPLYKAAGAAGIGIGGELYAEGRALDDIAARAKKFVAAYTGK